MPEITTIPKNNREEIRITRDDYQGHDMINIRVWYRVDDGEMRPGKQGIAFKMAVLPDVLAALSKMEGACA